jgi:type II secretory pathway pseudopilin PulG
MSRHGRLFNERGITVAEVLIAAAILGLGLAALMSVVPVASYAIQDGNQTSTATYLAQQRLEQVRNAAWMATVDCVGLSPDATSPPVPFPVGSCPFPVGPNPPETFSDEASVPGFTQYARAVRISDCGVTACDDIMHSAMRLVRVTVTYRPISAAGSSNLNTSVTLEWLVAQRL